LYIAGDRGTDRFFHNQRDGTVKDITESAIGFDTKKGMNVSWGDFDNDGLIDISVTDITDDYMREATLLWRNTAI
jgi:VCBS repeat protein